MNRGHESRLRLLESAAAPRRQFFIFDESSLGRPFDLEAKKEELRRERGITDADEVVTVSWLPPKDEPMARG